MIHYLDITETFIKTVGIEADSLNDAMDKAEELYENRAFILHREYPSDIEFESVQYEVEHSIAQGFVTPEEIEVF